MSMASISLNSCIPETLYPIFSHSSTLNRSKKKRWDKILRKNVSRNSFPLLVNCSLSSTAPAINSAEKERDSVFGELIRSQFPILHQEVNGSTLVYLDSAATSQKPFSVLKAMDDYYQLYNSNVHRGVHALSARATDAYEEARRKVSKFINAESCREIVYTRNASEAINLVSNSWGLKNIGHDEEILLTVAEHHSNLVPWQLLSSKTGAKLKFAQVDKNGRVDYEQLLSMINDKTKLVAVHHVSNALGSCTPVSAVIEKAHKHGAKVLLDACQSVPHLPIDVQSLNVDFLAASGHKMCGPTGIGFLYSPMNILKDMPPFMGGGEMINEVFLEHSTFAEPPSRFEAGTPPIAEAIGLGAAVDFLTQLGMENVHNYEIELSRHLYTQLKAVDGVEIYGPTLDAGVNDNRAALCSFNVQGIHPTDLSTFLDQQHGIAIRSGHHCTQPLHRALNINASARASLYIYNTKEEIDTFILALKDTIDFFNPSF